MQFNDALKYIVDNESKKMVGILLKRIDLLLFRLKNENRETVTIQDLEYLKQEQKELIYEAYRNLKDILKIYEFAVGDGVNMGKVIFRIKEEKSKEN